MEKFNPLRAILLATLQARPIEATSRYELMTISNQIFGAIDSPYSPGAIYHEAKKLLEAKMITINHESLHIAPLGADWLSALLSSEDLPGSITGRVYYLIVADLCGQPRLRQEALKRIEIEMIKIDHLTPRSEPSKTGINRALNTCLSHLAPAIQKSVIDIGAYK